MQNDTESLEMLLDRFSRITSLFSADRVSLATLHGWPCTKGRISLRAHQTASGWPWFLRPLDLVAVPRCFVELDNPEDIRTLALEADDFFEMRFYSFSRAFLGGVASHLRTRGYDPADVADQDPTYAEMILDGDSPGEKGWLVWAKWNRDCPPDVVAFLRSIDQGVALPTRT